MIYTSMCMQYGVKMEVTFEGCEMDMSTILIIKCISCCIFNRMTFLVNKFLFTDFLNVCNVTQVHKRFSTNAQRMHHRCTMEAPWMYNGSIKECVLDALRMHHKFSTHVLRMRQECLTGAPQMHFEHTMGAQGMPHACFAICALNTI